MAKELFNQNLINEPNLPEDNDRLAFGQPSVSGGKNLTWSRLIDILRDAISTFDSLFFNTSYAPTVTQEGEVYWNNKYYTPEFDTGLGKTVTIGNNKYVVFYNDTGVQIDAGICLHLVGGDVVGGEIYPTFEIADPRNYEKIQGTLTVAMRDIPNGQLGLCALFAQKITGVDTASIPAGSQLWIAADGTGRLTNVKPEFPNWSISVGGNYTQSTNGEIFVNFTKDFGDIYHEAWDGSVIESFDFIVLSDGITVIGTLSNVDASRNLTLNFSDGPFTLDTTTAPLSIVLTHGTNSLHATNYVYIPKATKVLTVSSSGFPETEHVKIARLELQSAASVQTDGGAYRNQNINDHIKKEDDNGHILHITERLRQLNAQWDNGSEATFNNTGGNGYLVITAGQTWQLHKQDVPALNMALGDIALIKNDFTTAYRRTSNLASITAYSDGNTWNNEWSKIVIWRVANKTGEPSFTFVNIPRDGYNSEANAISDALNYADYSIPDKYKGVGFLVAAFTIRISGGVITYNGGSAYEDLRGFIPNNVAGGGGGGGGVTSYLALTDTPSSYSGKSGNVPIVNSAESGQEFEPKGWFFNIARTFKAIFNVESLTADRTITWQDKNITVAGLDDIQSVEKNPFTETIEIANLLQHSPNYTQTGILNIVKGVVSIFINGTYEVGINCNGSSINFSSDFEIARNDYADLGNPSGKFRFIFALMSDGLIGVSVYQAGTIVFPTITSATVENADPDALVVVFDEAVNITDTTGLSLNFTTGTPKTLASVLGTGTNTLTFALSGNIVFGDIFTLEVTASNNITSVATANSLQPTSQSVTNNVGAPINTLIEDDFTGTTIDTGKWSIVNPDATIVFSQNNRLQVNSGAVSIGGYLNRVESINSFSNAIKVVKATLDADNYLANAGFGFYVDANNYISVGRQSSGTNDVRLVVVAGGTTYTTVGMGAFNAPFKIVATATEIKASRWNGSAWAAEVTINNPIPVANVKVMAMHSTGLSNTTTTVDDLIATDQDYSGLNP